MKRIVVAPCEARQIGYELGECIGIEGNAGMRDSRSRSSTA
jgi:hypothetical protein